MALHSMKVVARRTGLSPHVIRVWERRYGAVEPDRTETNRRLYSDAEIERLNLLRQLTNAGHGIGQIAQLPTDELRSLLMSAEDSALLPPSAPSPARGHEGLVQRALEAIRGLDAAKLEATLEQAALTYGHQGMLQGVVVPLTQQIGDLWQAGELKIAHEHFASALIRSFLWSSNRPMAQSPSSPLLLVTTPVGQLHELGAIMAAATAANHGWRVTYLGASLPAIEIAGAAMQNRARAVGLSIVFPQDDPVIPQELQALGRFLPKQTAVLVGGRAASGYAGVITSIGGTLTPDLAALTRELDRLRQSPPASEVDNHGSIAALG